ncbi:hypothetical protein RM780_25635 [Streptomyces sp. DSM 44917]|uniref:Type I restriction modification DNA specificity domain-containing protein n=1 Tax=Streptomyces boetiae TaxID=3075541 RepID=A0ABU2LFR8_9ACTN|nr:hypothetical protein [Streptomyces sp. DSM 44917]MDT0310305.1 hypothetical protein [Streptomyces sp. DSM 44917]
MRTDDHVRYIALRELGDIRMGKQLSPAGREAPDQFPYLRVANVFEGRIDFSDIKTMGFSPAERELFAVRPGDILLNEGQENLRMVGRSAIYRGDPGAYCFQNTLIRFRPGRELLSEYAQAIFVHWRRSGVFARVAEKTSISHLGGSRFGALPFPYRSLPEQRRIVEVINAVAAQERSIEASIAKQSAAQRSTLEFLLDRFEWDSTLEDASTGAIRNGFSPPESENWTGIYMLGLGCLTPSGFQPIQLKNCPRSVGPGHPALLRDGDLLMSRANTRDLVGQVGIYRDVGGPCIYPDLMMRIRPSKRCSADFLATVLTSHRVRRRIRDMAQGTSESMVKISRAGLMGIPLPLPSIEEQMHFLDLLGSFSLHLENEVAELRKTRTLRLGLTDSLLS